MAQQNITIVNKLGLHARAATKLVTLATQFQSGIKLKRGTQQVNAKSIMGVLMLAAGKGTVLELIVSGEDESDALKSITELIENRFGEEE